MWHELRNYSTSLLSRSSFEFDQRLMPGPPTGPIAAAGGGWWRRTAARCWRWPRWSRAGARRSGASTAPSGCTAASATTSASPGAPPSRSALRLTPAFALLPNADPDVEGGVRVASWLSAGGARQARRGGGGAGVAGGAAVAGERRGGRGGGGLGPPRQPGAPGDWGRPFAAAPTAELSAGSALAAWHCRLAAGTDGCRARRAAGCLGTSACRVCV